MKGYIYIPFLILILVAFGFVLSGGFILSKKSSSITESIDQHTLVEAGSLSNQTLQLSSLSTPSPTPTQPPTPTPTLNLTPQPPTPTQPQPPTSTPTQPQPQPPTSTPTQPQPPTPTGGDV